MMRWSCDRALRVLAVLVLGGCRVDGLDIAGKACPCGPAGSGYVCDLERDVCVPAADASVGSTDLARADLVDPLADLAGTHVLDVVVVGAPAGATVTVGGAACNAGCSLPLLDGPVAITTTAPPRHYVTFEGACQTTDLACSFDLSAPAQVTVTFREANIVFVTSTQVVAGNIGGLSGGDARCQALADAAHLPGTYKAWLSVTGTSAVSRLGGANGWIRPDGKPFAVSLASLTHDGVLYPPEVTEAGIDIADAVNAVVATGTNAAGTPVGLDAMGWMQTDGDGAQCGVLHGGPRLWTSDVAVAATAFVRLYCFGVDLDAPLEIVKTRGRRAFLSTATWASSNGVASADARCESDATAASLGGTWRALIATTGATAASRLSTAGPTWVRVDGLPLFKTASELTTATHSEATPCLLADGTTINEGVNLHIGAPSPTTAGTDATTCKNWTATSGGSLGGTPRSSLKWFSPTVGAACTSMPYSSVYCFEE